VSRISFRSSLISVDGRNRCANFEEVELVPGGFHAAETIVIRYVVGNVSVSVPIVFYGPVGEGRGSEERALIIDFPVGSDMSESGNRKYWIPQIVG
ncbi:MAG: hypothetical protein QG650_1143, partial [Patescibacteria group bacterium]|nr:hypothetical protein [Patescibacteria group bacterium]